MRSIDNVNKYQLCWGGIHLISKELISEAAIFPKLIRKEHIGKSFYIYRPTVESLSLRSTLKVTFDLPSCYTAKAKTKN